MQLTHYNSNFNKKSHPITLVCDNITNAPNIGSLFRIADAFGVKEIIFCGKSLSLGKRMTKTSRSTEKFVKHTIAESVTAVLDTFKDSNYYKIALEITDQSIELSKFKLRSNQPIVLVLGDENFGVSDAILQQMDAVVHINMYGNNSSMNVVQATGITLYELTKQLNS